eukprot:579925-Pelagomonas_calceolata.AAC.2
MSLAGTMLLLAWARMFRASCGEPGAEEINLDEHPFIINFVSCLMQKVGQYDAHGTRVLLQLTQCKRAALATPSGTTLLVPSVTHDNVCNMTMYAAHEMDCLQQVSRCEPRRTSTL